MDMSAFRSRLTSSRSRTQTTLHPLRFVTRLSTPSQYRTSTLVSISYGQTQVHTPSRGRVLMLSHMGWRRWSWPRRSLARLLDKGNTANNRVKAIDSSSLATAEPLICQSGGEEGITTLITHGNFRLAMDPRTGCRNISSLKRVARCWVPLLRWPQHECAAWRLSSGICQPES